MDDPYSLYNTRHYVVYIRNVEHNSLIQRLLAGLLPSSFRIFKWRPKALFHVRWGQAKNALFFRWNTGDMNGGVYKERKHVLAVGKAFFLNFSLISLQRFFLEAFLYTQEIVCKHEVMFFYGNDAEIVTSWCHARYTIYSFLFLTCTVHILREDLCLCSRYPITAMTECPLLRQEQNVGRLPNITRPLAGLNGALGRKIRGFKAPAKYPRTIWMQTSKLEVTQWRQHSTSKENYMKWNEYRWRLDIVDRFFNGLILG